MDLIESRNRILMTPPTYGGIRVLKNNEAFGDSSGTASEVITANDYFLAGPFDTGDTSSKSITVSTYTEKINNVRFSIRLFSDINTRSGDWKVIGGFPTMGTRTFTTGYRYIIATVPKAYADRFELYITVDGTKKYLAKGKNVTD